MKLIIGHSYHRTQPEQFPQYLYFDPDHEILAVLRQQADAPYLYNTGLRWQLDESVTLDQIEHLFADRRFQNVCLNLFEGGGDMNSDDDLDSMVSQLIKEISRWFSGFDGKNIELTASYSRDNEAK